MVERGHERQIEKIYNLNLFRIGVKLTKRKKKL